MLKKLFSKSKPKTVAKIEAEALSPGITQSIHSFLGPAGLPYLPSAAQKAFQLSINPNAEARDFVDVIKADEALSARIVKIANSVFFERGKKSETIEDCVQVIGTQELRNYLNVTALKGLFPSSHPLRAQFWANAVGTAIAAKILARRLFADKADQAFLGGLMHDLGKLLFLHRAHDIYEKVLEIVQRKGIDFYKAETEEFIFNHCELGQLIAERWNFSDDLKTVIRHHHQPWTVEDLEGIDQPQLVHAVKAADIIAHALSLGHVEGLGKFASNQRAMLATVWKALKIPESDQQTILDEVKRTYEYESDLYL